MVEFKPSLNLCRFEIWRFFSSLSTTQCRNTTHGSTFHSCRACVCARVSAIYSFAKIRIYSMKHCRISCDCSLFSILDLCPQWTFNNNKLRCFFLSSRSFVSTNVKKQQQQQRKMNKNFLFALWILLVGLISLNVRAFFSVLFSSHPIY